MKHFILVLMSLFVLSSCNFKEEITFNSDGSGELIMHYDMSEIMKVLEEMGGETDEKKEKTKVDSVVYFKDMLVEKADSIATLPQNEQEKLKALESIIIKIKMDEEKGDFDLGFGSTFTSLKELPNALEKIEQAKKLNAESNAQFSQMDESAVAKASKNMFNYVDFSFDGKTFSRSLKADYKSSNEDFQNLEAEVKEMGETKSLYETMSYTLVYNFPKKIRSVSNKNAVISDDQKTVSLKMNFIEMIKSPEMMTLDVQLED